MADSRSIGVFDSGVGGLTVARAILDLLPNEPVVYIGDSARYPYGPRPLEEIRRFALEIAGDLVRRDVKMLVVACNSVEVAAIADLAAAHDTPVVGVVDPGARAAVRATRNGRIGVIGTEATVASRAYDRAVLRMATLARELAHPPFDGEGFRVELLSRACPVFVERVEQGDTSSKELQEAAVEYLEPLKEAGVDTLILGCTHYPLLSGLISVVMGPDVVLISSAEETARDVYAALLRDALLRSDDSPPAHEFLTTGDPESFRELGRRFLGPEIEVVGRTAP
ncbi:MAG: glutamate racemase [Actinomycetota bacterium]